VLSETRSVQRRRDWPERLAAYVDSTRAVPFAWGRQDCVLWAAGAIREMTGVDPVAELRGRYADVAGAVRVLREIADDLAGAVAAVASRRGYAAVKPSRAQRGDLVLALADPSGTPHPDWPHCLGVCVGPGAVSPGPAGLTYLQMGRVLAAWRI
jgi:hypothetical protein